MIGRQEALRSLAEGLALARAGHLTLVLVRGDAGIGKTRLITESLGTVGGTRVLHGGCAGPGARRLPFSPLVQAFGVDADHVGRSFGSGQASGPALDGIGSRLAAGPAAPDGSASHNRTELFEDVGEAFRQLSASSPAVLVVEDLHWADLSTLDLLGFLARRAASAHALVIASLRSDEPRLGAEVTEWLADVLRLDLSVLVDLVPLSRSELAQLAQDIRGAPQPLAVVEDLAHRSGGNPYVAKEVLSAYESAVGHKVVSGAPSVAVLVELRHQALSRPAQEIAELVAVSERGLTEPDLGRLLQEPPAGELLDELTGGGVLQGSRGDAYAFPHDLVRMVVYDLIPEQRRRVLHRRHAEALSVAAGGSELEDALARTADSSSSPSTKEVRPPRWCRSRAATQRSSAPRAL